MNDIHAIVGKRLRELRQAKGYSIDELAQLAGLNPSHLGKIERVERNFTLATLDKLLVALEVDYRSFFNFGADALEEDGVLPDRAISSIKILDLEDQKAVYEVAARLLDRKDQDS